jgi:hypothetical protein
MRGKSMKGIVLPKILLCCLILLFISSCNINSTEVLSDAYKKITEKTNSVNGNAFQTNKYFLEIQLDDSRNILFGSEKVIYANKSNTGLKEIYFHIYPNAFSREQTVPVLFSNTKYSYPQGFKPCHIDIENLKVNNRSASFTIEGIDETLLRVKLNKTLKPGDSIDISMGFKIQIPEMRERVGFFDGTYNFGNWYPIAAVYDESGWNLDPFYDVGDPFYSETSDYDVTIRLPAKYKIASTGIVQIDSAKNGIRNIRVKAENVRDFTWVASTKFKIYEKIVEGINVRCFTIDSNTSKAEKALQSAVDSIRIYNKYFGKYPYTTYSIVQTHFPAGMEYPGLTFIAEDYFQDGKTLTSLESMIAHETAHQWWYGVVGNNEIKEAWLDESFATYSKRIYFEMLYGRKIGEDFYNKNILGKYKSKQININGKEVILKSIPEFDSWADYGPLTYEKGAVMLHTIRNEVGDEKFFEILKTYYDKNKFSNVKTQDFIDVVESITEKDWQNFFDKWLLDKNPPE